MQISEVSPSEVPLSLLLKADPSPSNVQSYLLNSRCFVAMVDSKIVGCYVIKPLSKDVYELMSIAIACEYQRRGFGRCLLKHAISTLGSIKARRLEVGTGSFGYQLGFYQKEGFRVFAIERDFFVRNHAHPIYEQGIQLKDMLRLEFVYERG